MTVGARLSSAVLPGFVVAALLGCAEEVRDACEVYFDVVEARYRECGSLGIQVYPINECTDELAAQSACLTPCIDDAPCGAITGEDSGAFAAYGECAGPCLPDP